MTQVIVTGTGSSTVVQPQQSVNVVTDSKSSRVITSGMMPPPATANSALGIIDTTNLQQGATLVYDADAQKWVADTLLEYVIIEQGQF